MLYPCFRVMELLGDCRKLPIGSNVCLEPEPEVFNRIEAGALSGKPQERDIQLAGDSKAAAFERYPSVHLGRRRLHRDPRPIELRERQSAVWFTVGIPHIL